MDAKRMQGTGDLQQARGSLTEMQGRADRLMGGVRSSLGRALGRFQGVSSGGFISGLVAFSTVSLGAMLILMPSVRESMRAGVNSRLPWGRRASLFDRLVNWFDDLLP